MPISAEKASQIRQAIIDDSGPYSKTQVNCAKHIVYDLAKTILKQAKEQNKDPEEYSAYIIQYISESLAIALGITLGGSYHTKNLLSLTVTQNLQEIIKVELLPIIELSTQATLLSRAAQEQETPKTREA